jgi:hypothetical protein
MSSLTYVLSSDGMTPVEEPDMQAWSEWITYSKDRIVQQETLPNGKFVSTIFMGIPAFSGAEGAPVLWETMVFKGDEYPRGVLDQQRCSGTRKDAQEMHADMVAHHLKEQSIEH